MSENSPKIIHVGCFQSPGKGKSYLFLRQISPVAFVWYKENSHAEEEETAVKGDSPAKALKEARRQWKSQGFRTVNCGFRYTLPERDEHGINALLHQMIASYSSMNGVYFDDEAGNNCFVQNASQEALSLWKRLDAKRRV